MAFLRSEDRKKLFSGIQGQYEALLDAFPVELRPNMIRSYNQDDFNSPGLLSLVALPFWVGNSLNISEEICLKMAVGNLFLLHSFQSFDFVVDGDRPDTSTRALIVLGSLCHLQVMDHYRPYFPADSEFWIRLETYWKEWGESILWEAGEDAWRLQFSEDALMLSAHKSAALKMCPTGLALLAKKPEFIPAFEQGIDLMHATMQLIDDLKDWREDLLHQRYNSFLGFLYAEKLIKPKSQNSSEDIAALMMQEDLLAGYAHLVKGYAEKAGKLILSLHIEPWAQLVASLSEQAVWMTGKYERLMEMFSTETLVEKLHD